MSDKIYNVLFLCTGNSARSILGESILNEIGRGRFRAFSAGSHPAGQVNPLAIELLQRNHMNTEGLRSKSWDEFATPDSPHLDFVFTVCDNAAGEVCPIWPGQPMTAHWGVEDPAAVEGSTEAMQRAFSQVFMLLHRRISLFASLPIAKLEGMALKRELDQIGREQGTGA
ncbi:MAG: arsenate reductase ArsC [Zoogloea sp.]|uniref:arsenate reductase ArsC n=1 Tax=Zoogloea sp. TaxID=49181 RepID=UPI002633149A|nr:arsenate reductase ArsC [Zoogloea sp.]MDD2991462.1 arsenate reductase ArsC [Zoogloea sp.]